MTSRGGAATAPPSRPSALCRDFRFLHSRQYGDARSYVDSRGRKAATALRRARVGVARTVEGGRRRGGPIAAARADVTRDHRLVLRRRIARIAVREVRICSTIHRTDPQRQQTAPPRVTCRSQTGGAKLGRPVSRSPTASSLVLHVKHRGAAEEHRAIDHSRKILAAQVIEVVARSRCTTDSIDPRP